MGERVFHQPLFTRLAESIYGGIGAFGFGELSASNQGEILTRLFKGSTESP